MTRKEAECKENKKDNGFLLLINVYKNQLQQLLDLV